MNFASFTLFDGDPVYIAPGFVVRKALKEEAASNTNTRIDAAGVIAFVTEDIAHVLAELEKL